jgi:hypothetical protein
VLTSLGLDVLTGLVGGSLTLLGVRAYAAAGAALRKPGKAPPPEIG